MQVHYDEGIANHIGPEPCAGFREDVGEASVGERAGQPLSRDRKLIPGADAVCVAEGNMSKSANASAWATRRGRRTWHARKLFVREPGDLRIGHRPLGLDGPRWEGEEPRYYGANATRNLNENRHVSRKGDDHAQSRNRIQTSCLHRGASTR